MRTWRNKGSFESVVMYVHFVIIIIIIIIIILFFEREHEQGRGAEEEREASTGSTLSTEPDMGLDHMTLGS